MVRRLIIPTWLNDRDQFLQPTEPLSEEFKTDGFIWMLFNRSNRTAGADGLEWNGKTWSLVNHFIPFTEAEVGWYRIRNALKKRNESCGAVPVSFASFEKAYDALSDKLRPQVFTLGFLR